MSLLNDLLARAEDPARPFLLEGGTPLSLADLAAGENVLPDQIRPGDVVALIGDFDRASIRTLLSLIDRRCIVMPLTMDSAVQHGYFFGAGRANAVIRNGKFDRRGPQTAHPLLDELREAKRPGLILFTSGSTGKAKAILHDFTAFLDRYQTPRPAMTTLNFLLFDHIGGINTLFHTLYNGGLTVRPSGRDPSSVLADIARYRVELLPTTPTFLRMLLLHGLPPEPELASLKLITYGTEMMDQNTLTRLARALPSVDIRQTYGMSELGILRIKTRSREERWVQVGGEGVETRITEGELYIRHANRMRGYLNAPSPFGPDGWYPTGDMVECDGPWLRFAGRKNDCINVGGLKVYPQEIEKAALAFPGVAFAKAVGRPNPLTGMHVELTIQETAHCPVALGELKNELRRCLPVHARPVKIRLGEIAVNHRFKRG